MSGIWEGVELEYTRPFYISDEDDDEDSDDSDWGSDSDESSTSSSDDEPGMSLREKFLKKTSDGDKKKEKKEKIRDKAKYGSNEQESKDFYLKIRLSLESGVQRTSMKKMRTKRTTRRARTDGSRWTTEAWKSPKCSRRTQKSITKWSVLFFFKKLIALTTPLMG